MGLLPPVPGKGEGHAGFYLAFDADVAAGGHAVADHVETAGVVHLGVVAVGEHAHFREMRQQVVQGVAFGVLQVVGAGTFRGGAGRG